MKETDSPYNTEAIRATMKHIGTVGYIVNSPYTVAVGIRSPGVIGHKRNMQFTIEVMFITETKAICRVVDGKKETKNNHIHF